MHAWRAAVLGIFLAGSAAGLARADGGISVMSPAFRAGGAIPAKYSYQGGDVSPELNISNVPAGTHSLVLIVDDPDSPSGLWTHWLVWNIPAKTTAIREGKVPAGAVEGKNSFGNDRYDGPVPPSGTHRYFFHVYALDAPLSLPAGASRDEVIDAMRPHRILTGPGVGEGELMGTYSATP